MLSKKISLLLLFLSIAHSTHTADCFPKLQNLKSTFSDTLLGITWKEHIEIAEKKGEQAALKALERYVYFAKIKNRDLNVSDYYTKLSELHKACISLLKQ